MDWATFFTVVGGVFVAVIGAMGVAYQARLQAKAARLADAAKDRREPYREYLDAAESYIESAKQALEDIASASYRPHPFDAETDTLTSCRLGVRRLASRDVWRGVEAFQASAASYVEALRRYEEEPARSWIVPPKGLSGFRSGSKTGSTRQDCQIALKQLNVSLDKLREKIMEET